jgi:hypothetical protein
MSDRFTGDRALEGLYDRILADDVVERLGTIFPVEDFVGHVGIISDA